MEDLIFFPLSGNCKEAVMVVEAINRIRPTWHLRGFVDDNPATWGGYYHDYPVLGGREVFTQLPEALVVAMPGRPENFLQRQEIIGSLDLSAERFATLIHPSVCLGPGACLGHNVVLMPNVVVSADTRLSNHILVLSNTVLSHDVQVDENTMIAASASIAGSVHVGRNCYIGSGASVISEISLGEQSLIGMGSVVTVNVPPRQVWAGNPAKFIRRLEKS